MSGNICIELICPEDLLMICLAAWQVRQEAYRRAASQLFTNAEELLRARQLGGSTERPLASLTEDRGAYPGHKGWLFGYLPGKQRPLLPLAFHARESTEVWPNPAKDSLGMHV